MIGLVDDKLAKYNIQIQKNDEPLEFKNAFISIEVRSKMEVDPAMGSIRFAIPTRRSTFAYVYKFVYHADRKEIEYHIGIEAGKDFKVSQNSKEYVATTYADFCWLLSDGTTKESKVEVETELLPNAVMGDLTWCVPSKFADEIIDVMAITNEVIMEGTMENSIFYGPEITINK